MQTTAGFRIPTIFLPHTNDIVKHSFLSITIKCDLHNIIILTGCECGNCNTSRSDEFPILARRVATHAASVSPTIYYFLA